MGGEKGWSCFIVTVQLQLIIYAYDDNGDNHDHYHEGSDILLDSRKLFAVKENMALQERLLDYEANGIIACKKCGQVCLLHYVQI